MKRNTATLVTAALALVLVAQAAEAENPFARDRSRSGGHVEQAHRYDHFPAMEFVTGTLNRDSWTGWELDDLQLKPVKDCHVEVDGSLLPGTLKSGRQALVMGHRQGDVLVAYRVRILRPTYDLGGSGLEDLEIQPSDSDPTVGVGQGPN